MMWAKTFYSTTIGKKIVMAISGIVLTGYLVAHVGGNLLVFLGADAINAYAATLKANLVLLWTVRVIVFGSLLVHTVVALQLTRRRLASRPARYRAYEPSASSFASRTMPWGGIALLLFVIYHILHFTTGTLHPAFDVVDVYTNVVVAFETWWVALIYVLAMVALGLHLYHGTWSVFQTLGVNHPSYNPARRRVATVLTILIAVGLAAIPIAIFIGVRA